MESIDIQRFNAHWTHEPGNVQRPTSNAQRSTKRFVESWMLNSINDAFFGTWRHFPKTIID
jgi:hypothetical protein